MKKVYRGRAPGLYDLESTNAATMHDVPVQWAALARIDTNLQTIVVELQRRR